MITYKILLTVSLFTTIIMGCNSGKTRVNQELFNESASISGKLGSIDASTILSWHMVTMLKNTKTKEISVLYANDQAFKNVFNRGDNYLEGSMLALVTWFEKPDIHWFGATIPGEISAIEQISIRKKANGQLIPAYTSYVNSDQGLKPISQPDSLLVKKNTNFILGLRRPFLPD